mmetsp:Transcript_18488/g.27687  ORF Transcript_18488/g.27687 Transcript_18488/m.27687 type:complete len:98 (+) Transcript_18488:184-477(+)
MRSTKEINVTLQLENALRKWDNVGIMVAAQKREPALVETTTQDSDASMLHVQSNVLVEDSACKTTEQLIVSASRDTRDLHARLNCALKNALRMGPVF